MFHKALMGDPFSAEIYLKQNHMNIKRQKSKFTLLLCIYFIIFSPQVFAGKIDDFERDATKEKVEKRRTPSKTDKIKTTLGDEIASNCIGGCADVFLSKMISSLFINAAYFGVVSWHRSDSEESSLRPPYSEQDISIENRKLGQALIPIFRVDLCYQNVESDVEALDLRTEVGYGPVSIQARTTHYIEDQPDDNIDIHQAHLLYRMSIGDVFEIDLGMGGMILEGDDNNSGISFTTPFLYHPKDYFGIEFRPSWSSIKGNIIKDYDLDLLLGWRFISFRAGYRWLKSENESLSGPFVGLSLRI
ncbi:MAG: hypothetical protein C0403_01935 [Desulfobacterium sp.]|nr:hypothetical protein [Desulfobacterium sp.]